MKKVILLFSIIISTAYADTAYQQKVPSESENDILTSQEYVDDRVGRSQDLIQPLPSGTTVDKIVTPPATAGGTPGARDIVTDLTNGASDGIPTSDAVLDATNAKNDKIRKLNDQNVVTYTGTVLVDGGRRGLGIVTGTPIYSAEHNTYENGLVRASTLNAAVQYAIDHELTRNDSDPQGTLWDVTALTVPAPLPVTANLLAHVNGSQNTSCRKGLNGSNMQGHCSSTLYANMSRGDWGCVFPYETGITYPNNTCVGTNCYKEIHGIATCTNVAPPTGTKTNQRVSATMNAVLNATYNSHKNGDPIPDDYVHCYMQLKNPITNNSEPNWVYRTSFTNTSDSCANQCIGYIVDAVMRNPAVRIELFGAY
ncbi:MAG: hypothetical protein J6T57_00760 [Alphaproteobacteria bacterium]|nr:hypothetical protein [Alphaproteobacteria bacterium]